MSQPNKGDPGNFCTQKRNDRITLHVFCRMDLNMCYMQLILHTIEFELIEVLKNSET